MPETDEVTARRLNGLAARALARAAARLGDLLGITIRLARSAVSVLALGDAVHSFGGEEVPVVAVQLSLTHDLAGQILLLFSVESAQRLIRQCLPDAAPPDLEESVLAEVGNVAGSAFVNEVADDLGLSVQVSPPQVATDMAGAVLGSVLPMAEAAPGEVLLIQARFSGSTGGIDGSFLLAPDGASLARLLDLVGGGGAALGR